jgi:hypothetical protein
MVSPGAAAPLLERAETRDWPRLDAQHHRARPQLPASSAFAFVDEHGADVDISAAGSSTEASVWSHGPNSLATGPEARVLVSSVAVA